jgi:acetate---CoA ligase (ADP-forming)
MADLQRLFAPRSIAVVGGAPAERVVRQCQKLGFPGPIWPVHPTRTEIAGIASVPTLESLPGVPDAVFLGVHRQLTVDSMRVLAQMSVGGVVCYASGFAESGESALQEQLIDAAGDVPFLGPNCYGFINTFDQVALWPDEHGCGRSERGAAIISQSGNVAVNLTFQQRGLRLGAMVSVGNQANIGMEDCIDAFLDDSRITCVGLFLEAVRDPQRFAEVARRAAEQGTPIVALQTGRSAAGALIATSHTGSMSGRAAAYDTLFARYGVATVTTPAELVETMKLLDRGGSLTGRSMVSLSCSGGEASLVADHSANGPLVFDAFTDDHRKRIEATLTELVAVSNPLDYHTFMWGDREAMATCFTAVMDGPQDATMLLLDSPAAADNDPTAWYTAADALADAVDRTGGRAVVIATLAESSDEAFRDHMMDRNVTPLLGLSEALVALGAAATVGRDVGPVHAPVRSATATRVIDEASAKAHLRTVGVAVPDGRVVHAADAADVADAADAIGYPITLKALGVAHKSETGSVRVGLHDRAAVLTAAAVMPASDHGYLVEATVTDVVAEVLVTVRRDPPIGWLVSLGFGGVTTELWADVTHLLAPVDRAGVVAALAKLRSHPLLTGFRGRPPADVDALADLVVTLTDAVVGTDVVEIELNPVLVGRNGATAVDALMIVEDTGPERPGESTAEQQEVPTDE